MALFGEFRHNNSLEWEQMNEYYNPEDCLVVTASELSLASKDLQMAIMREWFFQSYEDPAQNTPHETKEGGYMYLCGGPYDAWDVLHDEFAELVSEVVIDKLVDALNDQSPEWAAAWTADDYDQSYIKAIIANTKFHDRFKSSMVDVMLILSTNIGASVEGKLCELLYVNVITSVETYLSDAFVQTLFSDEKHLRKYVETEHKFKHQSIRLSSIYSRMASLEGHVRSQLARTSWHNLKKASCRFSGVLSVDFPTGIKKIEKAVNTRHDLVHRNGKTIDGQTVAVSRPLLLELIGDVEEFAREIDAQLPIDVRINGIRAS